MPDKKNTPRNSALENPSTQPCSCVKDPFSDLPPDLQPKNKTWKTGFRQVICPSCGLEYWTNCEGDLCAACRKKQGRVVRPR